MSDFIEVTELLIRCPAGLWLLPKEQVTAGLHVSLKETFEDRIIELLAHKYSFLILIFRQGLRLSKYLDFHLQTCRILPLTGTLSGNRIHYFLIFSSSNDLSAVSMLQILARGSSL